MLEGIDVVKRGQALVERLGCEEEGEIGYGMFHMRKDCLAWNDGGAEAVRRGIIG